MMGSLEESPKNVGQEEIQPQKARELYASLANDKRTKKIRTVYPNGDLVQSGHRFAILDHDLKQVTYFMRYEERRVLGKKATYQGPLWRSTLKPTEGVPSEVFWKHLFPLNGLMVTDRLQTALGKGFWRQVVGTAIANGLHVYFLDLNNKAVKSIESPLDLARISPEAWGDKEVHKGRLIAVSREPIRLSHLEELDLFGIPKSLV